MVKFLEETDLENIIENFYFTEVYKKVDKSTRKLLEDLKTFLISRLDFFYRENYYNIAKIIDYQRIRSIEDTLRVIFRNYY